MGRQKDILRYIRERWPSPDKTYRKMAEKLVKNYRAPKPASRGRPSEVGLVFELCTLISLDLINEVSHAQFREHVEHMPKLHEDIDDEGEFLLSIDNCKECEKLDLYTSLSRYRLAEDLRKILKIQVRPNATADINNKSKQKKNGVMSDRTLKRHLKAWVTIMHHPDWLNEGIPTDHQHLFNKRQIKYFDDYRETIQSHAQASDGWQLAITIKEFFNNTPLLVP